MYVCTRRIMEDLFLKLFLRLFLKQEFLQNFGKFYTFDKYNTQKTKSTHFIQAYIATVFNLPHDNPELKHNVRISKYSIKDDY